MAITLKQITGKIVIPGTTIGIRATVTATPMTTATALSFPDDDLLTWGPVTATTDVAGNLPAGFNIPTNSEQQVNLVWRFTAEPIDKHSGLPKSWLMGHYEIEGTGTIDLADLVDIDVTAFDHGTLVTLQSLIDAGAAFTQSAAASATASAASATSAAASASVAHTLVTTDLGTTDGQTFALLDDPNSLSGEAVRNLPDYVRWTGTSIVKAGTALLENDPTIPGGFAIGGQGPGDDYTILGSSGNHAWTQMQPTRVGSAYQHQLYPGGYAGVGTAAAGTDTVTISYGSLYGDLTDLYAGMPVGFNGRMYRLKTAPTTTGTFALVNMDGSAVSFGVDTPGVFKIAYVVSEGTADTAGTALTRTAGDYLHTGYYYSNKVRIGSTWYDVSSWADVSHLVLTSSAGTNTGVPFKQVAVDAGAFFTLLRLQGIRGGYEDGAAFSVNLAGQVRIDTNAAGTDVPAPDLVFGTGVEAELPTSVDFNSRKAHLRITGTGEVIAGAGLADPFNKADLASAIYDITADKPKFGAYRYSQTAMASGGTTRTTIARFGATHVGDIRTLDISIRNNFFGPTLQGRQGATTPVDIAAQPEGGNFVVGGDPATNATSGWLWISSTAGPPTGVPEATGWTGPVPLVFDRTNNKLYVYNGGWKGVTLA